MNQGKPAYRIQSMTEIRRVPENGFSWIETFSGCGGSSLGARMAGFKVLWANEFVPAAQDSYRANMSPTTILNGRDIKTVKAEDVLRDCKIKAGEIDVFSGSPPCQSFSSAGKREKGWGTEKDYEHGASQLNENLFDEYIRLRDGLMPRAFVAENVYGLVKGSAKGMFLEILRKLKRGYRVVAPLLDAQWLGVPQARQRIVFIGVRDDLDIDPPVPAPLHYRYSLREALAGLENAEVEPESDIARYAIGSEYDKLNQGQQSDKYFSLVRADPTLPCPTIMSSSANFASAACVVHPDAKRKFSTAELRRIGGFPDDFELVGDYGARYERVGNSVAPPMMRAVAEAIRDRVLIPAVAQGSGKSKRSEPARRRESSRPAKATATNRGGRNRRPA